MSSSEALETHFMQQTADTAPATAVHTHYKHIIMPKHAACINSLGI